MLSDQEIVRRLKALRYSPQGERYARRAPSLNAVTEASGLSQARIYQIIRQGTVGAYSRLKLNQAFSTLDRERERTRV
jgi:aminoglycoside phosphotransferase